MSVMLGKDEIWKEGKWYQSIDWGGSSLEGEVLTVSTQPMWGGLVSLHSICAQQVGLEVCDSGEGRGKGARRTRDWKLSLSLQKGRVCNNKFLRLRAKSLLASDPFFSYPQRSSSCLSCCLQISC